MPEHEVLNLPLDKFELYVDAALRQRKVHRVQFVADVAGGVSALFSKDGIKKYLDSIDSER